MQMFHSVLIDSILIFLYSIVYEIEFYKVMKIMLFGEGKWRKYGKDKSKK